LSKLAHTYLLQEALETVSRDKWATSNIVAKAYLECPKVKGILLHLGFKARLPTSLYPDVMQQAWIICARDLPDLDEPEHVYTWLYRTLQLTIYSMQTNVHRTEHLRTDEEARDEEQAIKPLAALADHDRGTHPDHSAQVISEVDLLAAQSRFATKLSTYDWPSDIIRDVSLYGRIGRPRKVDAAPAPLDETHEIG
jgi:hypothetical protein